jgi:hypothetical protein
MSLIDLCFFGQDFTGKLPENPFHQKYLKAISAKQEKKKAVETPKKRRIRCLGAGIG